jgi:hypothetical protein
MHMMDIGQVPQPQEFSEKFNEVQSALVKAVRNVCLSESILFTEKAKAHASLVLELPAGQKVVEVGKALLQAVVAVLKPCFSGTLIVSRPTTDVKACCARTFLLHRN